MLKILSETQIEDIARLAAADFRNPRLHELVRREMASTLREKGVDPTMVKDEHLLMAHVMTRAAKETGRKKFRTNDIQEIFTRAVKLIEGEN